MPILSRKKIKELYLQLESKILFFLDSRKRKKLYHLFKKNFLFIDQNILSLISKHKFSAQHPGAETTICISCIPKSASTYTQRVLEKNLPSFRSYRLSHLRYNLTGEDLFLHHLRCSIYRTHFSASHRNIKTLLNNEISKVAVLLRDPRDVLVSFYHQVEREGGSADFVYLPKGYFTFSKSQKINFLIDFLLPNLINYIHSWDDAQNRFPDLKILKLYYRDLLKDPENYFQKIYHFFNLPFEKFNRETLQIRKNVRYRRGIVGEYKKVLNLSQIERVDKVLEPISVKHGW